MIWTLIRVFQIAVRGLGKSEILLGEFFYCVARTRGRIDLWWIDFWWGGNQTVLGGRSPLGGFFQVWGDKQKTLLMRELFSSRIRQEKKKDFVYREFMCVHFLHQKLIAHIWEIIIARLESRFVQYSPDNTR